VGFGEDDFADEFDQFADSQVLAGADVDVLRVFREYGVNRIMKYGINKNGLKDKGIMGL